MHLSTQQRRYVRMVSWIAALGGLLFGYDTGVMSGALLFIGPEFDMSATQEGWVTSMLLVGAALGALSGGRVADAIGRRLALIGSGVVFVLGSLWCAVASSVLSLGAARTLLGVAVGAVSIVVPMYIAEQVPAAVRGRMVSLNTLMIVVGQLAAFLVNSALAHTGNWHLMLGLAAVPGAALAAGMLALPDTPVHYARTGRLDKARAVAERAGLELPDLAAEERTGATAGEWQRLVSTRWLRMAVGVAAVVGVIQQVTGVNAIVYFAPTLMNQVGISTTNAVYTSILIGTVSVVACWAGLHIIDRVGRRWLLSVGLTVNVASLVLLAVTYGSAATQPEMAYVALGVMAVFIASQQAAVSPVTWLLVSEIVPLKVRGIGMGLAGLALWAANWAVAQFFLPLVEVLSAATTFLIFSALGLAALGFVRAVVPETTGRGLEEVGRQMKQRYSRT
nr:sugar porter family MFS transporter [Corynebacterium uterequi]